MKMTSVTTNGAKLSNSSRTCIMARKTFAREGEEDPKNARSPKAMPVYTYFRLTFSLSEMFFIDEPREILHVIVHEHSQVKRE